MHFSSTIRSSFKMITLSTLAIVALISCSASQTVYDDDGIYSSGNTGSQEQQNREVVKNESSDKYKDYFEEGARRLEDIPEEGAIFTDVDSYTSEGDYEEYYEDEAEYDTGRAGWGEERENVVVNVYNNGGFGYGGFGYGFNRFGFGRSYYGGFGFNRFGFGWPYYGGFGYGGFGFVGNPFFHRNGFYNRPYFNGGYNGYRRNAVAYNGGRRASVNSGRRTSASRAVAESRSRLRSNRNSRSINSRSRATYSRNRGTARPSRSNRNGRVYRDGVSRGRPNSTATRPSSRPSSGSRPNSYERPNSSRPQGNRTRPSRPSRLQGNRTRPSRPSSRPSARPSRPSSRPSVRPSRPSSRPSTSRRGSFSRSSGSRGGSSRGGSRGGRRG